MRYSLVLLAVLFATGCALFDNNDGATSDINRQWQQWQAEEIDDYSFNLTINCFCPEEYRGPFRVVVRDGAVTSMTFGDAPARPEVERRTIDDLFVLLQDADRSDADEINVTYDERYSFPADFFIDYDFNIADEEMGIVVTNFVME